MSVISECPGRSEYGRCVESAANLIACSDSFKGANILITGATGMIGGALCRTLLYLNRTRDLNLKLILPVRTASQKTGLDGIAKREEVTVLECDLEKTITIDGKTDFIVHAACPTRSRELKQNSADVSRFAAASTLQILELARIKRPKGLVYLSSMEAYGYLEGKATEERSGQVDLTDPRSCYPINKRFCENAISCYAAQYSINACSARLSQVLGAGIKANEDRAYACFARSALRNEPIVLHTKGKSFGNYVHISDAITAICLLLVNGKAGQIYNVSGDNACLTIRELAQSISRLLSGGRSEIVFDIPENLSSLPYAHDTKIVMDNTKIKSLGWHCSFTMEDMILSLGKDLTETGMI